MEDILDGIKKMESYETKKQQWDVVREITGKQDEKEEKDREDFRKEKENLINVIENKIDSANLGDLVIDVEKTQNHLHALTGILYITNFDNISENKKDIENYKISILKDIKNKTLEQKIEIKECEDTIKDREDVKEKINEKNENLNYEEFYQRQEHSKKKESFFEKIKKFFIKKFFNTKRIEEISRVQREEEKRITKEAFAPLSKKEDNENIKINIENKQVTYKENEVLQNEKEKQKKEEIDKYFKSSQRARKQFNERIKQNNSNLEWKNGNVVIENDSKEKNNEFEEEQNIIE